MPTEERLDRRRAAFSRIGSRLAHMDDRELLAALDAEAPRAGWGVSHPATVGGDRVFVKRIPLTDAEYAHPFSTANRFRLPTYYNYGVGSAGFGAWRELVTHVKTTNWVLEGRAAGFPLLYHHRVVARRPQRLEFDLDVDEYVRRWNGSRAVGNYIRARAGAAHEVVLVLEHVPHEVGGWLAANPGRVGDVIDQLVATIAFLGAHDIVHFDVHFANVVTDGETMYLGDFGLALDGRFHLRPPERAFLDRHRHYDYGELLFSVGYVPVAMLGGLPDDRRDKLASLYGLDEHSPLVDLVRGIAEHGDDLAARGFPVDPALVAVVRAHLDAIVYMTDFYVTQRANPRKNTPYDDDRMRALLVGSGLL